MPENNINRTTVTEDLSDMQLDGLENLAGFIAFKFRKTEKLGYLSSSIDATYSWVDHLSEGGLMNPNDDFLQKCAQLEKIFNDINKDTLKIGRFYIQEHLNQSEHIDLSMDVRKLFLSVNSTLKYEF